MTKPSKWALRVIDDILPRHVTVEQDRIVDADLYDLRYDLVLALATARRKGIEEAARLAEEAAKVTAGWAETRIDMASQAGALASRIRALADKEPT